jgi:acetyl-CoA carboxylase carboxyl transferase subunit alpha
MTAEDLLALSVIDGIVPEPEGGAQNDVEAAAYALRDTLKQALAELSELSSEQLVADRYKKFRRMGNFFEGETL